MVAKMCIVIIIAILINPVLCLRENSALYQEIFTYHNETAKKAEFAFEVVTKIYKAFRQWFFTITFCEFTYFENRILKYTENYDYGYSVLLLNSCADTNRTKAKPRFDRHGATAYVVTANEFTVEVSDNVIEAFQRSGVFKPRSPVIFVVNEIIDIDKYFYYEVKSHFQLLWSRSITNSVLILKSDRLKIYSYNPYFDEVIDITHVEDISHFLSKTYKNLYGNKIRLSVFRKPYVSDETGPVLCNSLLAQTVMHYMNATCIPLTPRDGNTVGDLLDNGTATGVTADLMDGYTDFELSSRLLKNTYYGYIDTTYPLRQDALCFLVRNSGRQSTFTTTINLMTVPLLVTFALVFFSLTILLAVIRKAEGKICNEKNQPSLSTTTMELVKCFMRQTVDIQFWGPVYRLLIIMVIMYALIVNCVVDGIIYSALSNPRYKPDIDTMDELVSKTNLTIGVHNRDFKLFNRSLTDEQYRALEGRIEVINDQKITKIVQTRQFQYAPLLRESEATFLSRKPANMLNGRKLFHLVQECPVPSFVVYGLRYGSAYLPRVNFILENLNQAGILGQWGETEEYVLQRKITSTQKDRKALDLNNLLEVFYFLFIGLFVSLIVFFIEMLAYKYSNKELYL